MSWPGPVYPVLVAVALVAQAFVESGVSPQAVIRTVAAVVAVGLFASWAGRRIMGDQDQGALLALLLVLAFMAGATLPVGVVLGIGITGMLGYRVVPRLDLAIRWARITAVLSGVATVLILAIVIRGIQVGTGEVLMRAIAFEAPMYGLLHESAEARDPTDPDVILVLLDGMARDDVMTDVFGIDRADFGREIASRGVTIASGSRSNYATTSQTLAALFQMRPLTEVNLLAPLFAGTDPPPEDLLVRKAIDEGAALEIFRSRGYETVAISAGYEHVAIRRVDRRIDSGELNEFELAMLRRSILQPLLEAFVPDLASAQHRSRIDNVFSATVSELGRPSERPRFVFAHVPSPHAPWVHHADGTPRTASDWNSLTAETPVSTGLPTAQLASAYAGQALWVSNRLLALIDDLSFDGDRPRVVIFFSDHGTWIGAHDGDIRRRFYTFFAARFPSGESPFPQDVALVEVFPRLFDTLFGMSVPTYTGTPSFMTGITDWDLHAVITPTGSE